MGRLLVSELFTVGQGGWSGFPPHKHDTDRLPLETRHDETYNFRFRPNHGFGVQLVQREFRVVEHLMFECSLRHADGSVENHLGLNEAIISAASSLQMIEARLSINGESVTAYSCDGLIISTPVGSTGHSLSAGGPMLRQNLQAFVITPICPHTLTNRPLVDGADGIYSLKLADTSNDALLVIDGQYRCEMRVSDTVEIRRAPVTFKLAKLPGRSYYTTLQRKLGWSGQPNYPNRR